MFQAATEPHPPTNPTPNAQLRAAKEVKIATVDSTVNKRMASSWFSVAFLFVVLAVLFVSCAARVFGGRVVKSAGTSAVGFQTFLGGGPSWQALPKQV